MLYTINEFKKEIETRYNVKVSVKRMKSGSTKGTIVFNTKMKDKENDVRYEFDFAETRRLGIKNSGMKEFNNLLIGHPNYFFIYQFSIFVGVANLLSTGKVINFDFT